MASEGEEAPAVEEEPPEVHWVNEGVGKFSQHGSAVRVPCYRCCSIVAFEASRMVVGATYTQVPPSSRPPSPPPTPPSILHSSRHAQRMAPAEGNLKICGFLIYSLTICMRHVRDRAHFCFHPRPPMSWRQWAEPWQRYRSRIPPPLAAQVCYQVLVPTCLSPSSEIS